MSYLVTLIAVVMSFPALADWNKAQDLFLQGYHPVGSPLTVMSEDTFLNMYKVWPEGPYRRQAEILAAQLDTAKAKKDILQLTMERYGLWENPRHPGVPLGMDIDPRSGNWVVTCTACHAGHVAGQSMLGQPNQKFDLLGLIEETYAYRDKFGKNDLGRGKAIVQGWIAKFAFSELRKFGTAAEEGDEGKSWNRGQFEAWGIAEFGISSRRGNMDLGDVRLLSEMIDGFKKLTGRKRATLDVPAWWTTAFKNRLYSDGFAPKNDRTPMITPAASFESGADMRATESDYATLVQSFGEIPTPRYSDTYPGRIDFVKAAAGQTVFEMNCSQCHGTYDAHGKTGDYKTPIISGDKVKTDPVRLTTLDPWFPAAIAQSWIGYYGNIPGKTGRDVQFDTVSQGFVAPPLTGVWATAPYFHNGSAPTLWDVLHPDQRPKVWRVVDTDITREKWRVASYTSYDHEKMGLPVERLEVVPSDITNGQVEDSIFYRRNYFDGSEIMAADGSIKAVHFGKSTRGHEFPNVLTEDEKDSVLEYLKTL